MPTRNMLTVHMIISTKDNMSDRQDVFVALEGLNRIRRFCKILSAQTNKKAMLFAISKSRIIDSSQVNGTQHVILTEDSAHWDMM